MDLIDIIPRFKVTVCKRCRLGLLLDKTFDIHLRRVHRLARDVRELIRQEIIEKEPSVIKDEAELAERVEYHVMEPPLMQLAIQDDGLACDLTGFDGQKCTYVCRSLTPIKEHCKKVHGWVNVQRRGGSKAQRRNVQRPWREHVACQRLFHSGLLSGYWEVRPEEGLPATNLVGASASQDDFASEFLAEIKEKEAEMRAQQNLVEVGSKLDANAWLE